MLTAKEILMPKRSILLEYLHMIKWLAREKPRENYRPPFENRLRELQSLCLGHSKIPGGTHSAVK
jgi:hypothetical protein